MLLARVPLACRSVLRNPSLRRPLQTLAKSPHVYIFPSPTGPGNSSILTLLPTNPPNQHLALGSTTSNPPDPETFKENEPIYELIQSVIAEHATADPYVQAQAQAYASSGGAGLGSGGAFFPNQQQQTKRTGRASGGGGGAGQGGAGGASAQGGMGGGGVGGWVHVADQRNPPDWGRIAWPEDIFGSLQVDGEGKFVGLAGSYQRSGTYRICTRDGVLHLSPYLMERLMEKLKEIESSLS